MTPDAYSKLAIHAIRTEASSFYDLIKIQDITKERVDAYFQSVENISSNMLVFVGHSPLHNTLLASYYLTIAQIELAKGFESLPLYTVVISRSGLFNSGVERIKSWSNPVISEGVCLVTNFYNVTSVFHLSKCEVQIQKTYPFNLFLEKQALVSRIKKDMPWKKIAAEETI